MAIPIAVPIIASGLMSLFGAKKEADASRQAGQTLAQGANNAAQLQYDLGQQALGFQQQQWNTAQQQMQPWISAGQGAVGTLSNLMGLGSGGPSQAGGQARRRGPGGQGQIVPSGAMQTLGTLGQGGPGGQGGYSGPQMVQMQAPDGTVKAVPRTMVEHYRARGARVVGQ